MKDTNPLPYTIRIPIGDWSKDGHSQCEWFTARSNLPVDAVQEAFIRARHEQPKVLNPENACFEYEQGSMPLESAQAVCEAFPSLLDEYIEKSLDRDENFYPDIDWFACWVVEFTKLGNPVLQLELDPDADDPMLVFYGFKEFPGIDGKQHIEHFGYGLFE